MQSAEKPSLYDRLGGVYCIATVGDDWRYPKCNCGRGFA
jgi:hypothetical protein